MDTNLARFQYEVLRAGERTSAQFDDALPLMPAAEADVTSWVSPWRMALAGVLHRVAFRLEGLQTQHA
ncbi:hypothetical protein [Deinococcus pimensis]|uniref:hypothetical protein n=1 Tax=Deinococcus pimensis TaxID=309888 RepID=UPI00048063BC|nr:hypothetical protein [Deinococcus pimensis]